jgi:hypothetical protein
MNHMPIEVHEVIFTLNARPSYAIFLVHRRLDIKEEEKEVYRLAFCNVRV